MWYSLSFCFQTIATVGEGEIDSIWTQMFINPNFSFSFFCKADHIFSISNTGILCAQLKHVVIVDQLSSSQNTLQNVKSFGIVKITKVTQSKRNPFCYNQERSGAWTQHFLFEFIHRKYPNNVRWVIFTKLINCHFFFEVFDWHFVKLTSLISFMICDEFRLCQIFLNFPL